MSPQEIRRRAENMRRWAILEGMADHTRLEFLEEASKMEARAQKQEDEDNGKTH